MDWKKLFFRLSLVTLGLLLFLITACEPQVVEVEITRIVTETETVVEEVEVEVEVIKEVEVEVVKEVEVEAEAVEEVSDAEVSDADASEADGTEMAEEVAGGIEATGSEEDDTSPIGPNTGKGETNQEVDTKIGWIQASGVITDLASVRVLAPRTDDLLLVMTVTEDGTEQELILTHQIKRYRESDLGDALNNRLYLTISDQEWTPLLAWIDLLAAEEFAADLVCDFCAAGEAGERYTIITQDGAQSFEIDAGKSIPELDQFFTTMRTMMDQSGAYSQTVWTTRE